MISRLKTGIKILAAVMILTLIPFGSFAEEIGPDLILTGQYAYPIKITVASPVFETIAQFGKERTEALNKLLRHLSADVITDGEMSETRLNVDGEPVYSYIESSKESGGDAAYLIQQDMFRSRKREETDSDSVLTNFMEGHFFKLNRLLDDLYPVFEKTAKTFKSHSKSSAAVSLNFKGYGKGVRRLTIPLSDQYVRENFPRIPAGLAETEECSGIINDLKFSGPQKIILLYEQNDRLLRINYDGVLGFAEESMRKTSAVWRCVRTGSRKKDHLTLKTPAVKGSDKYNLTYEREADQSDPDRHVIKWSLQLDMKEKDVRKKIEFNADILLDHLNLSGKILYSEKQEGSDTKITIIPSMHKENSSEYSGTIEITKNSGKIVISSTQYTVRLSAGKDTAGSITATENALSFPKTDETEGEEQLQQMLDSVLVRKLLTLPPEDTEFFSLDIPEDVWNTLVQSLF